jgi:hypothetical protein
MKALPRWLGVSVLADVKSERVDTAPA